MNLKSKSKIKNIGDLYRVIRDLKRRVTNLEVIVQDEKGDLVTSTVFWLGGDTISLSFSMYMGLVMLGRQQYVQQNHYCLNQVPLRFSLLLKS